MMAFNVGIFIMSETTNTEIFVMLSFNIVPLQISVLNVNLFFFMLVIFFFYLLRAVDKKKNKKK